MDHRNFSLHPHILGAQALRFDHEYGRYFVEPYAPALNYIPAGVVHPLANHPPPVVYSHPNNSCPPPGYGYLPPGGFCCLRNSHFLESGCPVRSNPNPGLEYAVGSQPQRMFGHPLGNYPPPGANLPFTYNPSFSRLPRFPTYNNPNPPSVFMGYQPIGSYLAPEFGHSVNMPEAPTVYTNPLRGADLQNTSLFNAPVVDYLPPKAEVPCDHLCQRAHGCCSPPKNTGKDFISVFE